MDLLRRGRPRVVITGMGAETALGPVKQLWENLLAGRSGIRNIETIDTEHISVKIAAEVRDFDPSKYVDAKEARRMGRASQLAVSAAHQALEDAGLDVETVESQSDRVGVVVGTTLGSHELSTGATFDFRTYWRKPNPLAMVNSLPNMPAHYISKSAARARPAHHAIDGLRCRNPVDWRGFGIDSSRARRLRRDRRRRGDSAGLYYRRLYRHDRARDGIQR